MTRKIPTSSAELAEDIQSPDVLRELWKNPAGLQEYIEGYARNFAAADGEFSRAIQNEVQLGLGEFLKANGGRPAGRMNLDLSVTCGGDASRWPAAGLHAPGSVERKQSLYNKAAAGAQLDGKMPSLGHYMRGLAQEQAGRRYHDAESLATSFAQV